MTDTSAVVPPDMAEPLPIVTVPLWLHLGDASYRDGLDLDAEEFYRRLAAGEPASTSSPSPGDFLTALESAADSACDGIVIITVARDLSAIFEAARAAAAEFERVQVEIFDSKTAVTGLGWVVIEAARTAASGGTLDQVCATAERVAGRVDLVATLSTFRYLRRSGRVPIAQAWAGSTLRVRPVIRFHQGRIETAGITFTSRSALRRIVKQVTQDTGRLRAGIFHAAAPTEAGELETLLRREEHDIELFTTTFSPAMGSHTGPGVVGVGWWYD
ncbi:MAG: DegV family protein [Acidimicrobiia bacterium]